MTKTVGIVLAGGLSRRFGSPKAFAKRGNQYFYEWAMDALAICCDEIVVVTRPEHMERFPSHVHIMTDLVAYAGLGPLAGILSVMESVEADRYVVLPCDMPYVDGSVMSRLMKHHERGITAVVSYGRYHPLVSIWDEKLKIAVKKAVENSQLSVMNILSITNTVWINGSTLTDDEKRVFMNVNTLEALERG
ncbi:molybdenum cofactor guanylyltransferase [Sporosarcina sp. FSL K6-1508]|uniref:molybdenum cofactor guanylyltransferase n=1 Tax=Sporosarcina sp. FSL K6-1508 TaxID=2921553 RepID=UPI0030FA4441